MWFFKRRKRKRPSSATSSGVWRRLIWPRLWPELQKLGFLDSQIKEVFSLSMAISNEKNLAKLNAMLDRCDLRKLANINNDLPYDLDEVDHDVIRVFFVEANGESFLGLYEEIGHKELKVLRVIKIGQIELEKFHARQLIYPI